MWKQSYCDILCSQYSWGACSGRETVVYWYRLGRRGVLRDWHHKLASSLLVKCQVISGQFDQPTRTCQVDLRKADASFSISPQVKSLPLKLLPWAGSSLRLTSGVSMCASLLLHLIVSRKQQTLPVVQADYIYEKNTWWLTRARKPSFQAMKPGKMPKIVPQTCPVTILYSGLLGKWSLLPSGSGF